MIIHVQELQEMLKEGRVYYFLYFETSPVLKQYWPTYHNGEHFTAWTRVMGGRSAL
jgi:hypothetical protein